MTPRTVLVTGGAGFIGFHLAWELVKQGHRVRILDSMVPQVHGVRRDPENLDGVEMIRGDLLDPVALNGALKGVEVVFHQAAAVGVGQSMYEPVAYTKANCLGTALLMEQVMGKGSRVEKVILASSMSIYGEGGYRCPRCGPMAPGPRERRQLLARKWELECPHCQDELDPVPTPEGKPLKPTSVYAITKRSQEEMTLVLGRAYGVPVVALRYFNVYGPGQSLSNPYTGAAAIFCSRLLNGQPPVIYEDGKQGRDFVHVSDVIQANLLAMERTEADYEAFNVGTGTLIPLLTLVEGLTRRLAPDKGIEPVVEGSFREGDIRHCHADIEKIRDRLGFEPRVSLEEGFEDLVSWARGQKPQDRFEMAAGELLARGLVHER